MAGGSSSAAGPAGGSGGSGGGNNSGGPSGIGLGSAFYGTPASTSETDGETFDGDAEFEEYDDWDYAEILANTSKNLKTYVLQPLVVGAAAAFGMSIV